jgi:hypothetical protein
MDRHPTMNHEEVVKLARGSRIGGALPEISEVLERLQTQLKHHVFAALVDGSLTPQRARDAWAEMYSFHRLEKTLTNAVKEAKTIGEQVKARNIEE